MSGKNLVIGDPPNLLNSKVAHWTDVVVVDGKCYDKDAVAKLLAERDNAWKELREIRVEISANPEESTADEVRKLKVELDASSKIEGYQQACIDFCALDLGALNDLQPLIDQYAAKFGKVVRQGGA